MRTCDIAFEKIQKFSDPLVDMCPKCGGKVRKLLSSPAIQFKGSGLYITDYAKKSSSEASKAGQVDKASSESLVEQRRRPTRQLDRRVAAKSTEQPLQPKTDT